VAQAEPKTPASVLDASALLAHLREEEGAPVVRQVMAEGAAISVINWVEVLSKLAERGEDPELAAVEMKGAGLVGDVLSIEGIIERDSVAIARLRPLTRASGLSLADRACLALAQRLGVAALTGDRDWARLPDIGVAIHLIR
jgi:ribonuclease VapC